MSDRDNITLSDDDEEFTREDVTTLLLEVMDWVYAKAHRNRPMTEAEQKVLNDIRTVLAAEQPKVSVTLNPDAMRTVSSGDAVLAASSVAVTVSSALAAEPTKHPGYIIGSHWLETAYSRICAGEAEADVLRDIGLVREEAFLTGVAHLKAENEALLKEVERWRWHRADIAKHMGRSPESIDAAIDAAMKEDKT